MSRIPTKRETAASPAPGDRVQIVNAWGAPLGGGELLDDRGEVLPVLLDDGRTVAAARECVRAE